MLIVTAKVHLSEGNGEEFLDAVGVMKSKVLDDPGTLSYCLYQSADESNTYMFHETYEDEKAFAYHVSTEHFKQLSGTIDPMMTAPPEIGKWIEVA